MRRMRSTSVRYRPLTRKTRNDIKAAIEWVVETRSFIRESSRISCEGCNNKYMEMHRHEGWQGNYLLITGFLVDQPAFPFVPGVAATDGKQAIQSLLPFCRR